jgi:hypothetical protein
VDQSPQGFASEDEEATYCLSLLRDGDRHQQIVARERLSQIFERRGMLDEAAQCLESNIREGVRDPRVYQRLAGVYRRQGRHELADEVLVEARRLAERMTRPPQQGGRRAVSARPARPVPAAPPPDSRDVPTAQMPATPPPIPASPQPGSGGELELDWIGGGPRSAGDDADDVGTPPADRPWWLSPAMLVLLILLCGPYGLALMWVRGGYTKPAKVRATAVWAGLIVLILAAAAVSIQSQVGAIVAGSASLAGGARLGVPPTPIVFGTPLPKPALPPGLAAVPPTPAVSPGALATRPTGVTIQPAPATKPEDEEEDEEEDGPALSTSPTPGPGSSASAPASKPAGEQVKVTEAGGVNMRERPGPTGPVIKTVPEGTVLRIVGPDQQMDGKAWRNVRDDTGSTGWIVAELLEPA